MDFDLLFHDFPEQILPYDYEAYFNNPARYLMVTTNCLTGQANYLEEKRDKNRVIDIVRASSSLPFVCPIVRVDGIPMLDGGIVDSIPLMRARADGCTRVSLPLYIRNTRSCSRPSISAAWSTTSSCPWWSSRKRRARWLSSVLNNPCRSTA